MTYEIGEGFSLEPSTCTYAGTGYANPDAVTQIANGTATSSFAYDNNGNLTSAGTSTFSWDYNNRMTQAVTQGSTSTYSYDYAGNRASQVNGNVTPVYPNKYFSVTSSVSGATTTATTTVYVWNGDTLIATIDQVTVNGTNSGTSSTRYIHPDHLGSTNIVSDESGSVVTSEEYYPYGETRYNEVNCPTNEKRQYIGQFEDGNLLSYLNARYYDSARGQFESEDPVFLSNRQNLVDPQELGIYTNAAIASGVTINEIREALVQITVYCATPAGRQAFLAAHEALKALSKHNRVSRHADQTGANARGANEDVCLGAKRTLYPTGKTG